MNCTHHPKYDPASGEPTSVWNTGTKRYGIIPCPYCWQARAKWLEKRYQKARDVNIKSLEKFMQSAISKENTQLQERIKELEALPAYCDKHRRHFLVGSGCPECQAIDKARGEQV